LRRYETTFIVNPQADDASIDRQVTAIVDIIKADGGEILRENRIGTRRLAFPIVGLTQGYYTSIIFDSEAGVLPKLERHYKLEEPYIRYLTVRFDGPIVSDGISPFDSAFDQVEGDSYGDRQHRSYGFRGDRRHSHSSDSGRTGHSSPPAGDTASPAHDNPAGGRDDVEEAR